VDHDGCRRRRYPARRRRAALVSDAFPDRVFEGRIGEITPKGDTVQRTYRLRVSIASPTELRIGMVVEVNIVVRETKDAVLVPSTAIRGKQGKHVFVIEEPYDTHRKAWTAD
jgi:multidrug efflux pump subunit AcrA (membrane-fusion protein)